MFQRRRNVCSASVEEEEGRQEEKNVSKETGQKQSSGGRMACLRMMADVVIGARRLNQTRMEQHTPVGLAV